ASGMLPCLKIAETVTFQGRSMLEKSKQFVEDLTPQTLQITLGLPFTPSPDARFKV
ncbi:DNA polymerase, partial [Saguinine gammaherpesvirus 1]